MSKEHFLDDLSNAHNYHEIKHLAWGHTGTELAVVDAVGQISIYNVYSAIDRLTVVRRCSPDPEGHLSAVVGLVWAYSDKSVGSSQHELTVLIPYEASGLFPSTDAKDSCWRLEFHMLPAKAVRLP